jgi:Na+/H+ antiporter NhaC
MAFYQFPAPVAVFCGYYYAFILLKGTINEKFESFIKGCGNPDIIIMCIIYLLAGAFAGVSKAMGGVDSTVNLGLTYIPAQYVVVGLFIIAGFISTATGTSVGSIVALGPIAVGIASKAGLSLPLTLAAVCGGAMFGDNLSIISDTTIAATRTQGCDMRDKFKVNIFIAAPAAILTIVLLLIFGHPTTIPAMQLMILT